MVYLEFMPSSFDTIARNFPYIRFGIQTYIYIYIYICVLFGVSFILAHVVRIVSFRTASPRDSRRRCKPTLYTIVTCGGVWTVWRNVGRKVRSDCRSNPFRGTVDLWEPFRGPLGPLETKELKISKNLWQKTWLLSLCL